MRSSAEAVAVARDVASSSPSKNASALDMNMMSRYQRISPDCLPLANGSSASGSGSTGSRKAPAAPAQEPRSSVDVHDAAQADTSRLASYLAAASLEPHKPRAARGLLPTPVSSSATGVVIRSPARDHGHLPSSFVADYATQNPNPTGGNSSGVPDGSVRLQWGHNKRSRGRRDNPVPPPPSPAPATETPAQARRRASIKIQLQRRNAAASASASAAATAEKLMPPPSARGGPVIRAASSLPHRAGAAAAAAALSHHRSAEEPHPSSTPARKAQQHGRPHRQASEKEKGKAAAVPEAPVPLPRQPAAEVQKLAARPEVPRIFTTLSRREKEEDFLAMKGAKLPQRPKKRPKAVEKAVSTIYPGQWLSDVSRSRYMVREKKSKKQKRGGGLKAMDSDSD